MRYVPALDGLRALAVLAVMAFHLQLAGFHAGYLGVEAFFVLSGYLITAILLRDERNGGLRLGRFYLRRARRLYPALIGMVVLYLATVPTDVKAWQDALIALTYVSDYAMAFWGRPGVLEHTWSLAVEEHFYLLWPLALPFVARLRRENAIYLLSAVFVGNTVWRLYVDQYAEISNAGFRFDTRLSGLALGCMIAFLPSIPRWVLWLLLAAFGALTAWLWIPPGFVLPIVLGPVITAAQLATAAWVLLAVGGGLKPLGTLAYVGRLSYGLYLYHWPVQRFLIAHTENRMLIIFGTVAVAFIMAMLSYHTIEAWARKPRSRTPILQATNP